MIRSSVAALSSQNHGGGERTRRCALPLVRVAAPGTRVHVAHGSASPRWTRWREPQRGRNGGASQRRVRPSVLPSVCHAVRRFFRPRSAAREARALALRGALGRALVAAPTTASTRISVCRLLLSGSRVVKWAHTATGCHYASAFCNIREARASASSLGFLEPHVLLLFECRPLQQSAD